MLDRLLRRYPGYTLSTLLAESGELLQMIKLVDRGGGNG